MLGLQIQEKGRNLLLSLHHGHASSSSRPPASGGMEAPLLSPSSCPASCPFSFSITQPGLSSGPSRWKGSEISSPVCDAVMGRPLTQGPARSCLAKGRAAPPRAAWSQLWSPDAGSHLQAPAGTAFWWGAGLEGALWTALFLRFLGPAQGWERCSIGSRKLLKE